MFDNNNIVSLGCKDIKKYTHGPGQTMLPPIYLDQGNHVAVNYAGRLGPKKA